MGTKVHDGVAHTDRTQDATGAALRAYTETANVHAVVLAGIHDWGGCPLDSALPRPLMPVAGRPVICHVLDWLRRAGLSRLTVCSNLASRHWRSTFDADGTWGDDVDFYQDVMPRGPAGCVADALQYSEADAGLIVDGTLVPRFDLRALLRSHEASGAVMTVVASYDQEHEGQFDFFAPAGVYVLSRSVLDRIAPHGYVDLKEGLIPALHEGGLKVVTYRAEAPAPRVINVDSYLAVNHWLLESMGGASPAPDGYRTLGDGTRVHPSAKVASSARLVGPVLIGPRTTVEGDAMVVGPTSIGSGCRIESGAVVCRSVLWDQCQVEGSARLDRCVMTHRAVARGTAPMRDRVLSALERSSPKFEETASPAVP